MPASFPLSFDGSTFTLRYSALSCPILIPLPILATDISACFNNKRVNSNPIFELGSKKQGSRSRLRRVAYVGDGAGDWVGFDCGLWWES